MCPIVNAGSDGERISSSDRMMTWRRPGAFVITVNRILYDAPVLKPFSVYGAP